MIIYIVWESDGECQNFISAHLTEKKAQEIKEKSIRQWIEYCKLVKKEDGIQFSKNLHTYDVEKYHIND